MTNMTTLQILQGIHDWVLNEIDEQTADFITNTVDNLVNYYKKSETYTKSEVQQIVDTIKQFIYEVVQVLPTASESTMNKLYLVPAPKSEDKNVKEEYITIRSGSAGSYTYSWELLGTTSIDLSNYYTKGETDSAISAALTSALQDYTTTEDLMALLDTKANIDGFYETMGVGTAMNLVGKTENTNNSMYRKTGGAEEATDGTATLKNIKGNTVAWNQQVKNPSAVGSNTNTDTRIVFYPEIWSCSYEGGEIARIERLQSHQFSETNFNISTIVTLIKPANHDVYGLLFKHDGNVRNINMFFASGLIVGHKYYLSCFIETCDVSTAGGLKWVNKKIIDLTLIYGSGNEPTTVEQFEADYLKWFGKPLTYEEYDAGSLRSVQLDAIKTTGFNQYNNGSAKVIGGLQYQITGTYTGITLGEETITPDANGLFTPSTTGTLTIVGGGGDTCVHISGDRNGEYEPYEEHIASVPTTTLTGKLNGEGESVVVFPDGMKSAGNVHDEIYSAGGKTYAVKRVGSVDLGSLEWTKQDTVNNKWRFTSTTVPNPKMSTSSGVKANIICSKYNNVTPSESYIADSAGIAINTVSYQIAVADSSYSAATTFKAAMNGVILYYELETPLVYEVEGFTLPKPYVVNGDGTEEQVQKQSVQGVASTLTCSYGMDAVKTLMNLPQRFVSAAEEQNFSESQKVLARRNIGVEEILAHKANQEGVYEGLTVGLADNLRGDTIVDAEFYCRKSGGTQSVTSGIAAIKEVKGKSIVWNQLLNEGKLVDMGLPSGTLWASCNIDITQPDGFAASPFQYDCSFFSWGNVDGHNPISTSAFDYDFGGVNAQEPWYEGQPYGETQGNTLTGNIPVGDTYDAARVNVGTLWRMPTKEEFEELFANIKYINADGTEVDTSVTDKRVTVNGVRGIYLESTINGARMFFPCSGYGNSSFWFNRGERGHYWSLTWNSARFAQGIGFYSGGVNPQSYGERFYGFALRPVMNKTVIDNGKGGHKYAQYNNNISDLTLMFGAGNEPNSVAEFEKMFPLDYYDYNAGEVIPFAGKNLVTTGFNQWDEEWENGSINTNTGENSDNATTAYRSKNYIKVFPNTTYYYKKAANSNNLRIFCYRDDKSFINVTYSNVSTTFITPNDCAYIRFLQWAGQNISYNHDICINISDPNKNGTYEPYEKHTLPLDPSQWRDKNGDLVFPYGGMHGVGTAFDYAKVDADGYIRKAVRVFGSVDLGSLSWMYLSGTGHLYFRGELLELPKRSSSGNTKANLICGLYENASGNDVYNNVKNKICAIPYDNDIVMIFDNSYSNASTFKSAMQGVMFYYELAEPVEVELATPVYANYYVNGGGTEAIEPDNGAAPYTAPANLSILYAMDARGEINNLPKNYLSKESAENMLGAMQTAGIIGGYTMTWDSTNSRYVFVIQKNSEQ